MRKLSAEVIGTFLLVAVICGATMILLDASSGGSGILGLAIVAGLSVVVYAVGRLSALLLPLCMSFQFRSPIPRSTLPDRWQRRGSPSYGQYSNSGCFGWRRYLTAPPVGLPTGQSVM